jgi:NAD(P)-dependent dehydrogenase (short-subunit alcohol dehydrogenase family)
VKLANRTALITGASRGIGRAIARAFAREGADLIITARTREDLASLRDEATALGRQCLIIEADLSKAGAVDAVWREVERAQARVDVLVNNAGIGSGSAPKPVVAFDDAFWDLTLRMNLTVPYQFCKKALPGMAGRRFGRVIAIASINGLRGGVYDSAYTASKSGLLGLTRTVAREHVKDGITANAICPGTCATQTSDARLQYEAHRTGRSLDEVCRGIGPMGRRLEPEELTPIAVYLASAEAAMTTGQTFVIDGGQLNA